MSLRAAPRRLNAETARTGKKNRLCALCMLCVLFVFSACSGGIGLFQRYEYEEEVYLSLDGTATVYVNSSLAALNALRGTSFDTSPAARFDQGAARAYFSTARTRVVRISQSRRNNRRFAHLRLEVDDIRTLGEAAPFAWSTYRLRQDGNEFVYRQTVGAAAGKDVGRVGWNGRERIAFRLHLPSKITDHNTRRDIGRGNILTWEQPLADRLRGVPLSLEARMDSRSILYRTLWLFGATCLAVVVVFGLLIWWATRRGAAADRSIG